MNIMTKRGQIDNIVTYQYYCDTANDLQDIPQQHTTLGSVAIVLSGSDGGLQIYIANSNKQWNQLTSIGGSGSGSNIDLSNYLLKTDIATWAKAENKPTYTAQQVGALPSNTVIPSLSGYATQAYVDARIPTPPQNNGTYNLQLTINNGQLTYQWINMSSFLQAD